jgi:lambda family phage portal protein
LSADKVRAATQGAMIPVNWLDRTIAWISPNSGVKRVLARHHYTSLTGYESAEPSIKRRFSRNNRSGEFTTQMAAGPLRNQARHLQRNHDIARGVIDKLVGFTVGPDGIGVEFQPKDKNGEIHEAFAQLLTRRWKKFSEWPEVTWSHDWGASCRLVAGSLFRDGEVFAQMVTGPRNDQAYATDIPFALELLEADMVPHHFDDAAKNLFQGIRRNAWNRAISYMVYREHPGGYRTVTWADLKEVPAERILHLRLVDRLHQMRGISIFSSVIARLQDIYEYEDAERIAAKTAASLVLKLTRGMPEMWTGTGVNGYDPQKPPVYQMEGGMIVVNTQPGETADMFDTKRPNANAAPFVQEQVRRVACGVGLSYSSASRDYNGTYSAQRQELVEHWPQYQAGTCLVVAQFARPTVQTFIDWVCLVDGVPADVDLDTLHDADYLGPPMIWIDPEKEANANLILVQARFKSSAAVIRSLGGQLTQTYKQIKREVQMRKDEGIGGTADVTAVSQAKPAAPEAQPTPDNKSARSHLQVVK